VIEHGKRIRAVFTQPQYSPLALGEELALLAALAGRILDAVPLERIGPFRERLREWLTARCPEILAVRDDAPALADDVRGRLAAALSELAHTLVEPSAAGAS
jgi:F-type H+-transporting ATPase subunit alpha